MDAAQVNDLLSELKNTRNSFDKAVASVRWNRLNTAIMYALIFVILIMLVSGGLYYISERKADCRFLNSLRVEVNENSRTNARAIGIALAAVSGADDATLNEYIEAYNDARAHEQLHLRDC